MQGEQFNMKLDKGTRGFGFSLVAAPTFSSDVSDNTDFVTSHLIAWFNLTVIKLGTDI